MSDNMQVSIYHIDRRIIEKEIKSIISKNNDEEMSCSTEDIIEFLLNENKDYREQQLKEDIGIDVKGFKTKVLYRPTPPKETKWRNFFKEILNNDSKMLKSTKQEESFMVFIYNEKNIYAITGGFAFHKIECYLDSLFGIKILSGLINRDTKTIKGVTERNVSRSIMATTKMFRIDYSISEDDEFGKIYKEIIAQLDSKVLEEKLGFKKDEIKKVQCIARTYFKITKSINLEKVYEIIEKLDKIMEQDIQNLNKVHILNTRNKSDKELIDELEELLIEKLYNDYIGSGTFSYNICDNNYQGFLFAGNYCLKYRNEVQIINSLNKADIIKAINEICDNKKMDISEKSNFIKLIKDIKILSFEESVEDEATNSKFLSAISSEIEKDGSRYFIMEGTWFYITEDYINELNTKLEENIKSKLNANLITNTWTTKIIDGKKRYITETEFMKENFLNDSNVIITHTKLIDNIEFSDLLKIDQINKKIYLIHIKRGFDASVRDLSYQMMFSYRILRNAKMEENYKKLEDLYDKLDKDQKTKLDKENFIRLFKENEIIYVFTFDDETKTRRKLNEDVSSFESNIAKGVLLDLIRFYNSENIKFEVVQIETDEL